MNKELVEQLVSVINWESVSIDSELFSYDFIDQYKEYIDWEELCESKTLTEEFIRRYKDYVHWTTISMNQELSEDFIREFQDKVNWEYILTLQKLSIDFVDEFSDRAKRITKEKIYKYQNMLRGGDTNAWNEYC